MFHHPCKRKSKFFGVVSVESNPRFVFQKADWFNAKTFQQFLKYLLAKFDNIFLILDNASYHRAKSLKPFLKDNKDRLWLFALPPYSPELNVIEMVWRETRRDATHNRYFPTIKRLTRAIQTQFRIYQKEPEQLSGIVAPFL